MKSSDKKISKTDEKKTATIICNCPICIAEYLEDIENLEEIENRPKVYVVEFKGIPEIAFETEEDMEAYFREEGTTLEKVKDEMENCGNPRYAYQEIYLKKTGDIHE